MRILHLLDSLNRGGTETFVLDICRNAAANGFEMTFVATGNGTLEDDFQNSGVEFIKLPRKLPIDFSLVFKLRKIIKERKIEFIHAHQAVEGIHAYLAARGTKAKVVLSYHAYVPDKKNRWTLKYLIPRVSANVVVSKFLLKFYAEEIGLNVNKNFRVLYNGVDNKRLTPTGKNLRDELKLGNDALLIGMIGNFYVAERKDQMTLCESLPKVFAEFPDAHCIFAGGIERGAEAKFEKCVKFCKSNNIIEKVSFLGVRNDVPDILAALDLFIFSSLHEGLPIALNEAMLAEVPLIVSDIEPLLEATENGKYAEVFRTKNADELSIKIIKLLQNKDLCEDFAKRAKVFADETFSIEAHLRNLKSLYEAI
jgi:glycosyltransferase involved in cell wall biosynthesis